MKLFRKKTEYIISWTNGGTVYWNGYEWTDSRSEAYKYKTQAEAEQDKPSYATSAVVVSF